MRKMLGFLMGVFVGALVGSTITLLLTPESGEQLRAELRARGERFFLEIRSAADARRAELERQLEDLRAPRTPSA
ncbi:MAG: hypothetical protein WHV44_15345 [Anaerolineales bacterium]